MPAISSNMSVMDLLKVANDHHIGLSPLSDDDKKQVLDLLRLKGAEELDYGEEFEFEKVKLVRRVTGAVSIFFDRDEPTKKKSKE